MTTVDIKEHGIIDEKYIDKTMLETQNDERGFLLNKGDNSPCWFFTQTWEKNKKEIPKCVYHASYVVGAQWIKEKVALVVTPKKEMEQIDFVKMFMSCVKGGLASKDFSRIYGIDFTGEKIETNLANTVLDPLLLCHFLSLVEKIAKRGLKKGYVYYNENLKKCRGRVDIYKNERQNVMLGRCDRVYCKYSEYGVNISENKIIKKALLISKNMLLKLNSSNQKELSAVLGRCLTAFEQVDEQIDVKDIKTYKENKLYKDYSETIRLARVILQRSGYSISESNKNEGIVPPFWFDMSALFEYYLLYIMRSKYGNKIIYQEEYPEGFYDYKWRPDYLFDDDENSMILDAKYIPDLNIKSEKIATYVRQLSGYARIKDIREKIHVDDDRSIPCVLLYPPGEQDENRNNAISISDFQNLELSEDGLQQYSKEGLYKFYLVPIKLPIIGKK